MHKIFYVIPKHSLVYDDEKQAKKCLANIGDYMCVIKADNPENALIEGWKDYLGYNNPTNNLYVN